MAYAPIAFTLPQYEDYPNWWMKAYEQGTTTPLSIATDSTGGTLAAKIELNVDGFPVTAGAVRFIPFINGDFDLWLFPTAAEADANDTTNAIQLADNVNADPRSGSSVTVDKRTGVIIPTVTALTAATPTDVAGNEVSLDSGVYVTLEGYDAVADGGEKHGFVMTSAAYTAAYGAVDEKGSHTLANGNIFAIQDPTNVKQFGAKGDGATDDRASIAAADAVGVNRYPSGTYVIGSNLTLAEVPEMLEGAKFSVSATFTLTLSDVKAAPDQHVFTGAGTVTGLQNSYPDWFGAVADGSTDDSVAANAAIQATSGNVFFREDAQGYRIAAGFTLDKSITLDGFNRALLICDANVDLFDVSASDITIKNFRVDGNASTPPTLVHLNTNTTTIERLFVNNMLTFNCTRLVYDDNHVSNTAVSIYFTDVQCRLVRERGVFLQDAFAFIFFSKVLLDYVGVTDVATNVPAFSVANNQGLIVEDFDVLGGTVSGFGSRTGFNVEDSAAVLFRRCNADTMGGYGFRIVNVESCRLETTTASLCDQHGYLIAGTTFDLQGTNVYAGGRQGLGGTASQHGFYVIDSAVDINVSCLTAKNNTGDGLNTSGTSGTFFSSVVSHNNAGRGVNLGGTASLVSGARITQNTTGNYNLTGAFHHLSGAQLNSGGLVDTATGPVSG